MKDIYRHDIDWWFNWDFFEIYESSDIMLAINHIKANFFSFINILYQSLFFTIRLISWIQQEGCKRLNHFAVLSEFHYFMFFTSVFSRRLCFRFDNVMLSVNAVYETIWYCNYTAVGCDCKACLFWVCAFMCVCVCCLQVTHRTADDHNVFILLEHS